MIFFKSLYLGSLCRKHRKPINPIFWEPKNMSEKLGVKGFQDAKRYEEVRPGYPKEAVKLLLTKIGVLKENGEPFVDKKFNILELGAGTGKFTRVMADVLKDANVHIVASDPVKGMCDQFREVLPDIEVKQFSAENIDAVDQSFDAVIAVGCFHWFSLPKSLHEIHRVLVPGGMFGIAWNFLSSEITWQKTICNFLAPMYERNSIVWPVLKHEKLIELVSQSDLFFKEEENSCSFFTEKKSSPEEAFKYMNSISVLNTCSDEEKREFRALFEKIIEKQLEIAKGKELTFLFQIPIFWFKKTSHS